MDEIHKLLIWCLVVFIAAFIGTTILLEALTPDIDLNTEADHVEVCLGVRSETQEIYLMETC